ncbi:MAG: helix-turn-helix domain-containing protein [Nitriliruptorales bacterium]|nr:helix-turn-helix domain-containing protein [Nitriliruptorales bacterium]
MATATSSTVLKAFQVLELFAEWPLLGAGDAARLLGAPRASVHRLLVTLKAAGVLESTDHGQYRLGLRLFELGSFAPLRQRLHDQSILPLQQLAAQLRLPVNLGVRDSTDVLFLEKVHHRENTFPTRVGQRRPLHATSLGKVLLAYAPPDVLSTVLESSLPRFTPHTSTDPAHLQRELKDIRNTGLAYNREESRPGLAAVATRVRNHTGKTVAAIGVSAPACRYAHNLAVLVRPLQRTAAEIEHRLGWCPVDRGLGVVDRATA